MTRPAPFKLLIPLTLASLTLLAPLALYGCGDDAHADGGKPCNEDCAYADSSPALGSTASFPLRTRIVEEDLPVDITNADPFKMLLQDEVDDANLKLTLRRADGQRTELPGAQADDEGYVDARVTLPAGVPPGQHVLEVLVGPVLAGEISVRLLPPTHAGLAVRSDVDMTYLVTDFESAAGLADLMESDARERAALPGMPAVYRALRDGADGQADRPLCFLSGSPRFFKRTLEGRMQLDGVRHDGIVLKPFKDLVAANLLDFDFESLEPDLKEQVGYKMTALLTLRLDIPPTTPEILMGDDTEVDHAVYALYHRFTAGELDAAGLDAELARLDVAQSWRDRVAQLAPTVTAHLAGQGAPVKLIYINRINAHPENLTQSVADWTVPGLTRHHRGAWPLILDLFEEGHVSEAQVNRVRADLDAAGTDAAARQSAAADGVASGFLDQATADRFAR